MKKVVFFFVLLIAVTCQGIAQDEIYYTRNAALQVIVKYENKSFIGETKDLRIKLDYETADIEIQFYLNALNFKSEALNNLVKNKKIEIVFKGELSLAYVETKSHPPLDFSVSGWLKIGNNETSLTGQGELHHVIESGDYVCRLGMAIYLNLNDLNMDIPPGLYEEVEVIIIQALLERGQY